MSEADEYTLETHFRTLAAKARANADREKAAARKAEWQRVADCYAKLAAQQSALAASSVLS